MSWSLMRGAPEGSGRRLPVTKLMVTHDVDVDEEAVPSRVQDQGSLQLLHCEPISLQAEGTIIWGAGQDGSISSYLLDTAATGSCLGWQLQELVRRSKQAGQSHRAALNPRGATKPEAGPAMFWWLLLCCQARLGC